VLQSDPFQYKSGFQFVALVNRCDIAEENDRKFGLVPNYTTRPCLSDYSSAEVKEQIESLQVTTKMVG